MYLCCMPAIQFVLFDRLKSFSGEPLSSGKAFVLGAMARAVAVSLTYPFTRAKAIVQTQKAKSDDKKAAKSKSVIGLLQALIREEGFFAMYRGFYPELLRGVLSAALMLMIKEKVKFNFAK